MDWVSNDAHLSFGMSLIVLIDSKWNEFEIGTEL